MVIGLNIGDTYLSDSYSVITVIDLYISNAFSTTDNDPIITAIIALYY